MKIIDLKGYSTGSNWFAGKEVMSSSILLQIEIKQTKEVRWKGVWTQKNIIPSNVSSYKGLCRSIWISVELTSGCVLSLVLVTGTKLMSLRD